MTIARASAALLAAFVLTLPIAARTGSPGAALVGTWKRNDSLSDAKMPEPPARGDRSAGGPGGGPPPNGGPPPGSEMGGGRGGRPVGPPPKGDRSGPPIGAEVLRIGVQGTEVRIAADSREVRILTADGTPVERQRGKGTVTETADWEGAVLVVSTTAPDRPALRETLALAEDGSDRLVQTVQLPARGSEEPRTLRWVYDRSAETAAPVK
jgi:hypothetical protein